MINGSSTQYIHMIDQRRGEFCRRLERCAGPIVDRSLLAAIEVRKAAALPDPSRRADLDAVGRAVQVQRARDRRDTIAQCGLQGAVYFRSEQGSGQMRGHDESLYS